MAVKNTKNARLLLSTTLGGAYTAVNKTHGLKFNLSTDWAEATAHGDTFKSYTAGLMDFGLDISAYYDTVYSTLEAAAKNGISYFFQLYIDFADTVNYYRGQAFFGFKGLDASLGNTADFDFEMRIANADIQLVRAGAVL